MKKKFVYLLFLSLPFFPALSLNAALVPQRSVLPNGLTLLTSEQRALPMVTFNLLIKAGSRYDPSGSEGLAKVTARLLTYGTKKRTALQISDTLDFIGASLSTSSGKDLATVSLTLLKKDLDVGLKLLAEILTESVFPPREIERKKQSAIASIKAKKDNPRRIARKRFLKALFPHSPYGRPVEGTEESVKTIEQSQVVKFYKRFYRPTRAILAVVGDVSHQEILERLADTLQPWEGGPSGMEEPPSTLPGPTRFILIDKKLTQANILMGHEGVRRGNPDYYALQVMNYILGGGGFSSRMMDSIRNERGLAYSVYSFFSSSKKFGTFQVGMQTKNENAAEAIRIAKEEIRRIRERGVSQEELKAAKDYLIGSFPLRFDTNSRIAAYLAQVEFFGLGLDYLDRYPEIIRRITRKDILRVARSYLHPKKLIVVVVANQAKTKFKKE
ncbi:MAG: M16 family metallopeptidase [Candidatus Binatia bacterium]